MEPWERWRFEYDQSERKMPWGAPQDPRDGSQPRSAPPPEGGQREGADREDLAKRPATHHHRRSALDLRHRIEA